MSNKWLGFLSGAASVCGIGAFLVAPQRVDEELYAPFQNRNIAHRGLHCIEKGIPENSIASFNAACEAGYGSELDVQLTKDGQVVVFHDDDLKRVCGGASAAGHGAGNSDVYRGAGGSGRPHASDRGAEIRPQQ